MTTIICVQEYPESGDQAVVWFVDIDAMANDKRKVCQAYAASVQAARQDPHKTGQSEFICYDQVPAKHCVNPPCQIVDAVTLYEP